MSPVIGGCRLEPVQVGYHFCAVLGVVADGAAGLVEFVAHFANCRVGMTGGAVTFEDCLAVERGGLLIAFSIHVWAVGGGIKIRIKRRSGIKGRSKIKRRIGIKISTGRGRNLDVQR